LSCDGNGTAHSYEELRPPAKWNKLIYFARKVGEIKKKYAPNLNLFTKTICVDQKEQNKWNEIMNPLGWTPKFRNWLPLPDSLRTTKKEIGKGPCRFISAGKLYVRWNGDVTLCCYHPHSAILGNLKQQKFSEIIKGKKRADILSKLHHHRDKMKVCGICQMR
jgi:radical SAM protein with 4Fe4S-binding SPASM domain